jgi:hypothetical protein
MLGQNWIRKEEHLKAILFSRTSDPSFVESVGLILPTRRLISLHRFSPVSSFLLQDTLSLSPAHFPFPQLILLDCQVER